MAPRTGRWPLVALVPLLLVEDQRFWFLAADGTDEVESFVRLGRLALPGNRPVRGRRRLDRVLLDLAIPASSVSEDAEVSRFWLTSSNGPQAAELALQPLAASPCWLLRLHAWRCDEQPIPIAGRQRSNNAKPRSASLPGLSLR